MQETCPTPPRGETEETGMLRGGASTSRQAPKTKHLNWERVFGGPRTLSLSSTAQSLTSQTRCRFQTLRQVEEDRRKWWVDLWHTRVANTLVFQCDVELLTKCIKKLRKHKSSPDRDLPSTQFHSGLNSSGRPSRTCSHLLKLLGNVWLGSCGKTHSSTRSFSPQRTDASRGVFALERASEMAKEWKKPSVPGTAGPQEGL